MPLDGPHRNVDDSAITLFGLYHEVVPVRVTQGGGLAMSPCHRINLRLGVCLDLDRKPHDLREFSVVGEAK